MFSREYFNYLLRSKRYLILFIFLISLLNIIGSGKDVSMFLQCFIAVVMCFAIPFNVFYFIHDRKAIDTFFSIPVSRKAMMITSLVFAIALTYLPFAAELIVYSIFQKMQVMQILIILAEMFIATATLITFNTSLYLLANNSMDGMIMTAAYTCMPLSILFVAFSFLNSYVCGMNNFHFEQIGYLSPLYISGDILYAHFAKKVPTLSLGLIVLLIILAASYYFLNRNYVDRDVERANTPSSRFFAYPFVIHFYVAVVLFLITSFFDYSYSSVLDFISDQFVLYLIVFAIYVAAHFLYKRKLYFSYKLPLIFVSAVIISFLFAGACRVTKGFGISYMYDPDDAFAVYELNGDCDRATEQYVFEKTGQYELDNWIYVNISTADRQGHPKESSPETLAIFDSFRRQAIEEFYSDKREIQFYNDKSYYTNLGVSSGNNDYYYSVQRQITLDELLTLAKDGNVSVYINTMDDTYRLMSDGSLMTIYNYY